MLSKERLLDANKELESELSLLKERIKILENKIPDRWRVWIDYRKVNKFIPIKGKTKDPPKQNNFYIKELSDLEKELSVLEQDFSCIEKLTLYYLPL